MGVATVAATTAGNLVVELSAAVAVVATGTATAAAVVIDETAANLGAATVVVVAAPVATVVIAETLAEPGAAVAVVATAVGSLDQFQVHFLVVLGAVDSAQTGSAEAAGSGVVPMEPLDQAQARIPGALVGVDWVAAGPPR